MVAKRAVYFPVNYNRKRNEVILYCTVRILAKQQFISGPWALPTFKGKAPQGRGWQRIVL